MADRAPEEAVAQVNGFACTKCGGQFAYSEGHASRSGLVCGSCVPKVATTEGERRAANRAATRPRARLTWELIGEAIADLLETLFY